MGPCGSLNRACSLQPADSISLAQSATHTTGFAQAQSSALVYGWTVNRLIITSDCPMTEVTGRDFTVSLTMRNQYFLISVYRHGEVDH